MMETTAFRPLLVEELTEIEGGSTKAVAAIATVVGIGFTIAAAVTGSEWCAAGAAVCATVVAICGLIPAP